MPQRNLLSEIIKIAGNQRDVSPIENILLNLRVTALSKHSRSERRRLVLLGVVFSWISALLLLPISILFSYKTTLASLALAIVPFKVFELISFAQFLLLSAIIWAALNYKDLSQKVQHFVVDLFDFISAGRITEAALTLYQHTSHASKQTFLNPKNQDIISHLYSSRQSYLRCKETLWEDYFSSMSVQFVDDQSILDKEVQKYWSQDSRYYAEVLPPSLDGEFYWERESFWKNLTPAVLSKAVSQLSNIDERRDHMGAEYTILSSALMFNADFESIEFILKSGANPNGHYIGWWGEKYSVLAAAIRFSPTSVIQLLLDSGAEVNSKTEHGRLKNRHNPSEGRRKTLNILQLAAVYAQNVESFLLIKNRCKDQTMFNDIYGNSLLHLAAQSPRDQSHIIKELLANGIDVNDQSNNDKNTPLMCYFWGIELWALGGSEISHIENLKTLMNSGADISLTNVVGRSLLEWLSTRHFDEDERCQIEDALQTKINADAD